MVVALSIEAEHNMLNYGHYGRRTVSYIVFKTSHDFMAPVTFWNVLKTYWQQMVVVSYDDGVAEYWKGTGRVTKEIPVRTGHAKASCNAWNGAERCNYYSKYRRMRGHDNIFIKHNYYLRYSVFFI